MRPSAAPAAAPGARGWKRMLMLHVLFGPSWSCSQFPHCTEYAEASGPEMLTDSTCVAAAGVVQDGEFLGLVLFAFVRALAGVRDRGEAQRAGVRRERAGFGLFVQRRRAAEATAVTRPAPGLAMSAPASASKREQ